MIEANPRFIQKKKKNTLWRLIASNKMLPAWPRNLSAISPVRNVACMYAHTPMHTAEIWKNVWIFLFPETILSFNQDKYFAFNILVFLCKDLTS